jgi:hypothetical protein
VWVRKDGFKYDRQVYRSVSAAVRAASGTPWTADAQREAAEAYIRSQAGEGWTALPGYPERRYPARRSFSRAWCKSIFIYVW